MNTLLLALLATVSRLTVAYVISVVVAIPLALFITSNTILETIFLPIFDILESIPILAFFPVIILIFLRFNFLNGAAIFIIFLGMVWNLLFTLVGGLKLIPRDIIDASNIFHLHGEAYFWKVILPSIVPQLVTGSILAVAQGWNIIIVAEVMHVYLPGGTNASDLFGIGTILVHASGSGQMTIFIMAIITMVLTIACFNFFIWQKLLHYAQRYRFE